MTRRPLETFRPGSLVEPNAAFGHDYAVPLLTRRTFALCGDALLAQRETLPHRFSPSGLRRPPC